MSPGSGGMTIGTTLRHAGRARVGIGACVLLALCSCSKPKAPQFTPREAAVTSIDLVGVSLRVKMDAFNPNGFPLAIQSMSARVVIDDAQDLGAVTVSSQLALAADAHTLVDVPMSIKWRNLGDLTNVVAANRGFSYVVLGTATVGGESLNVEVPFKLTGVLTELQLRQFAAKSLQGLPGLAPRR